MKPNTFVIGDIHGALKGLSQVIETIPLQQPDRLIFVGDYVDGWPQSAQVIDYLMALEKKYYCVFIKGNHDAWCEEWLATGATNSFWLDNGGTATINSYKDVDEATKAAHLTFFRNMKMHFVDDENRLFIHAGYTSMQGPEKEVYASNYYWDRTLWEMAVCMDERIVKNSVLFPKRLLLYKEIFIGHTPTIQFGSEAPMKKCNVWNVDTGAAFTGKITALNIDTARFWQSDNCYNLYPGEKGRNR